VTNPIEARLDVAFEDPLGRRGSREEIETLFDRVGSRAFGAKSIRIGGAAVICFACLVGCSSSLVLRDQWEGGALSREVMLHSCSTPIWAITAQHSLFPPPVPAAPSAHLATAYPSGRTSGLPGLTCVTERGRFALSAGGVCCPRLGMCETQNPPQCQFGASRSASWACFHLRRLDRRLLARTLPLDPRPYPPDAGRPIVASRCRWWSSDHG
jgi:hypothetical protein